MKSQKYPFVVAITGASGAIYGIELVKALASLNEKVIFLMSPQADIVIRDELRIPLPEKQSAKVLPLLFPKNILRNLEYHHCEEIAAPPASGSFRTQGMIICPCSQATLSAIRTGASRNLIDRSADVCLKEGRRLILVPREMPLSPIHLENMLALSRIGVRILPAAPAFYHKPKNLDDLIRFVVGKILDSAEIDHNLFKRWKGINK